MLELRQFAITEPVVLEADDMTLQMGRKYALMGPSGSGKSSILKAIAGFLPTGASQIKLNAQEISHFSPSARSVSMLFQQHNLFMHLHAKDNMAIGLAPDLRLSQEARERLETLASELRIETLLGKYPRQLSGGEAARVALARVILQARDMVFFDEPFGALGPAQKQSLQNIIETKLVQKERLVIFVTHQPEDAAGWADEILWLNEGHLYAPIAAKDFFEHPRDDVQAYLGSTWR